MANAINTRIQLKYDSYTAWEAVKDTFKPLKGEICIVNPGTNLSDASTTPCLMKVGDGTHVWKDLPWVSATAADVYSWAKKSWADFQAEILPVITAAVAAGAELDETTVNNVKTINHEVKLTGGFTGAQVAGSATGAGQSVTIKVPKLTVNEYGHITAVNEVEYTVTIPNEVAVGTGDVTISAAEGSGVEVENGSFNVNQDTDVTINVKHADTSDVENVTAADRTYVKSLTFDDFGHVTAVTTGTETVVNTAHTHSAGSGLKLTTGAGGVDGNTEYAANLDVKYENSKIYLVDSTSGATIGEGFDASAFVKDSFLENATYNSATNKLVLTFVDNTDNKEDIEIDLTDLVDVYTGDESIAVSGYTISLKNEIHVDKISEKSANGLQLSAGNEDSVITLNDTDGIDISGRYGVSINGGEGHTEITSNDNLTLTANTGTVAMKGSDTRPTYNDNDLALLSDIPAIPKVGVDEGVPTEEANNTVAVVTGVQQNGDHGIKTTMVNNVVTEKGLSAAVEDAVATAQDYTDEKIQGLHEIATTGSIYDIKEGANSSTGTDTGVEYLIFNCGSSTTVI